MTVRIPGSLEKVPTAKHFPIFRTYSLDLCQIRLDFDTLVTANPSSPEGMCGDTLTGTGDSVVVRSPTGFAAGAAFPPDNICGTLTGQHSYSYKIIIFNYYIQISKKYLLTLFF